MSSEILAFSRQLLDGGVITFIDCSFHNAIPSIESFDLVLS
ncbi:MAG: hypothetical protein VYE46_04105 [Cyanobacteriota bacterium]|nr:hypothetical protein [Cyanobacteriota bacterium]